MENRPQPQKGILEIAPYVPGRSTAHGASRVIKLSANESPLGASPKAIEAVKAAAEKLDIYPEGSSRQLRETLGEVHSIDAERIIVGAGSDEVLHLLAQTYIGDGDEAVMSQYGFMVYPIVTRAAGGTPIIAAETDYRADVDALLAAVTDRTKIVFLANPNNPTGTYLDAGALDRLHAGLPSHVVLVIDSAYAEYVTAEDYGVGISLVERAENVVMVRTFSKMGLAAARVGWLYGPEHVVDAVNRIRGPFNVSVPGQVAATAAARDTVFTKALRDHNARWRDWLTDKLASNRLRVLPSQGNFILVLFPDTPGQTASDANAALLAQGLVVREMGGYGIDNGLRISIGTQDAMEAVAECLNAFMEDK
ncbi:histidinol-phosphate transaminase [Pelagibacterium lentulum]|uniref:Histidinol-phosphate aminotransferase n=1 Tax=Pelagibacterium lentulum TaxID=2029865 RepID=A0A916VUA5_9HYPH|nr:histidinol-phosphate transaminase [Pelagibacterium lentulum]GGA35240.1 histidinol-phosphate aminotransferase 2 [Pelagibacterium lentulum]